MRIILLQASTASKLSIQVKTKGLRYGQAVAGTEALRVLKRTFCERYFTAGGQWDCSLNVLCYSEHYFEILDHED
jgi:hypothetical protein